MTVKLLMAITFCGAALYIVSAFLIATGKLPKLMNVLYAGGMCINLFLVLRNAVINGYVPFVSMYQVLTFHAVTMTFSAIYMCMVKKQMFILKFFPALSGIILVGVGFMSDSGAWHFPPALDSPFFVPHVLLYMISYTLCAVSFVCCVWGMIFTDRAGECENACGLLVKTALPFMLSGMLCGATWANEVWGEFWTWDVKECFSLLTLLFYSGYLHMRRVGRCRRFAKAFVIIGFFALVFTLLFVDMIPSDSLHTYS